jgi:hypothetical protein
LKKCRSPMKESRKKSKIEENQRKQIKKWRKPKKTNRKSKKTIWNVTKT